MLRRGSSYQRAAGEASFHNRSKLSPRIIEMAAELANRPAGIIPSSLT